MKLDVLIVAAHPDDAARVASWRAMSDALHAKYDSVADEPVPARLRLAHQQQRRVRRGIDRGERIHLDRDAQSHDLFPARVVFQRDIAHYALHIAGGAGDAGGAVQFARILRDAH